MWHIHMTDYYSAIKGNEALIHATMCMNLDNIVLSQRSHTHKSPHIVYGLWYVPPEPHPDHRTTCGREMKSHKGKYGCCKERETLKRQKVPEVHYRESGPSAFPKPVPSQCSLLPSNFILFLPHPQLQSGIGRLILKEEMKARSSSYADPWTPPRSSTSSREALHTAGYDMSLNGCKHCPVTCRGGGTLCPISSSISESNLLWPHQGLEYRLNKTMLRPEQSLLLLRVI